MKMTKYFWKIQKIIDTNVCCHEDDKVLLDDKKNNDKNVCCHEDNDVLFDDKRIMIQMCVVMKMMM